MAKKAAKKSATKAATKKAAPKKAASKKSATRPAPSAKASSKKVAKKKSGSSGTSKASGGSNTSKPISKVARATLRRLEEKDPGLGRLLKKAHAYVVFPSVGKAALVVGGSYGRGAVFEKGRFVGHATVGQTTAGLQIGGETFSEVLVFENAEAFERFKRGKVRFAANASAVLVKAGAVATKDLEKGIKVLAYSKGGMLVEAAVGGQKFKFRPAGKPREDGGGSEGAKGSGGRSSKSEERSDESSDEDSDEEADEESEDESDEPGPAGKAAGRIAGKVVKKAVGLVAGGATAEAAGKAAAKAVAKFADKAAADAAEKALAHVMSAAAGGRRKS